jgi:hypothetical protein
MVHARGHQPHRARIGSIEPDELGGLGRRRRQHAIRLVDHRLLGFEALRGLRRLAARERVVLDLPEGVERGDERRADRVLHRAADPAAQPVVGVHDVVATAVLVRHAQHAAEELRQEPRQLRLRDVVAGPRLHAHHPDARRERLHLVVVTAAAPGEQVHCHPATGEPLRDGTHVDVHATGIARAGLIHGRRVHAEHGDAGVVVHPQMLGQPPRNDGGWAQRRRNVTSGSTWPTSSPPPRTTGCT